MEKSRMLKVKTNFGKHLEFFCDHKCIGWRLNNNNPKLISACLKQKCHLFVVYFSLSIQSKKFNVFKY